MSTMWKNRLLEYVTHNDRENVEKLVKKEGPHILNEEYDHPYYKPILHIACEELSESVRASTIETLINLGANIYHCSSITQKEAIHAAIEGKNPKILQLIVKAIGDNPSKLNATSKGGHTALSLLVRSGEVDSENFYKCLDILLASGLDVNKPDGKMITPILWAAYKGYKNVIQNILQCGQPVELDSPKLGGKTARVFIQEKNLYDGILSAESYDTNKNLNSPLWYVKQRREAEFLQLGRIDPDEEDDDGTILQWACTRNLYKAVKKLLELNADVYRTTPKNKQTPLEIAADKGNPEIFKLLIVQYRVTPTGILTTLLMNVDIFDDNNNYKECLNILLEKGKDVPVNEYSKTYNTPLHYSSSLADPSITLKLLGKGASLANENKFNFLALEDIDPNTLEKHFDSCVTVNEQTRTDKQSIVVNFDYKSLIPTSSSDMPKDKDDQYKLLVENDTTVKVKSTKPISETNVVHVMSKIPEMHHLLVHPLIASFIDIKWHRLRWFFIANLALFLTFTATFVAYVFVPDDAYIKDDYSGFVTFLWIILMLSYCVLVAREVFQFIVSFKTYCCSLSNVLELVMLVTCFYPIFYKSPTILYKQLSSIAMVLIALEVMVLLGQHPTMSTNIVMLRTVAKNFFSFLLWYAVLILAFVLCFYKLFNQNDNSTSNNSTKIIPEDGDEEKEQDFFVEPGLTFIKTIVMLTGEFDASSINFNSVWNRLIFLLFIFMIPIILFNLLNGLAVSDTQQIKKEAEIIGYRERISYIVYIESIILGNAVSRTKSCSFPNCFDFAISHLAPEWLIKKISLVPDFLPEKTMDILLYHDGIILRNGKKPDEGCIPLYESVRVRKKTVKRVKQLLHSRNSEDEEASHRIRDLEDIIRSQREVIQHLMAHRNNT